jgi:hypothetical protein
MSLEGQWWQSKTNPAAILEILAVSNDGAVRVEMAGTKVLTSLRYLRQNYRPLGEGVSPQVGHYDGDTFVPHYTSEETQ